MEYYLFKKERKKKKSDKIKSPFEITTKPRFKKASYGKNQAPVVEKNQRNLIEISLTSKRIQKWNPKTKNYSTLFIHFKIFTYT